MQRTCLPLILLLPLAGCGGSSSTPASTYPSLTGNWQIQSMTVSTGVLAPATGVLLLGELTSSGAQVTGTFRLANYSLPNSCPGALQQVITVTGSIDSSRNLTLTSAPFSGSTVTLQLPVSSTLTAFNGTIAITGGACTFSSTTAFGFETQTVTGVYSGPVSATPFTGNPPITTGTAALTLTQSPVPAGDGQFPLTGTLTFNGGGCTSSTQLTGTVSGSSVTLSAAHTSPLTVSPVELRGNATPTPTQLIATVLYGVGPCSTGLAAAASYNGTLIRQ